MPLVVVVHSGHKRGIDGDRRADNDEDQREDRVLALRNSRLEEVQLTAALLEKFSLLHVSSAAVPEIKCPTLPGQQTDYQAPAKDTLKTVVFDINPGKQCLQSNVIVSLLSTQCC